MIQALASLEEYLKIFAKSGDHYKSLVGDSERVITKVMGDASNQIASVNLQGITEAFTTEYQLFWEIALSGSTVTFSVYKDAAKLVKVCGGSTSTGSNPLQLTLSAENSSGITGTVSLNYSTPDIDNANVLYVIQFHQNVGIIHINDFNTGAISNLIEYTRRLSHFLVDQLTLTSSKGSWLQYMGKEIFGIPIAGGESDSEYVSRIQSTVLSEKTTVYAIEKAFEPYADEVILLEGIDDGAFSEVSFSDNVKEFSDIDGMIVKAAYAGEFGGTPYFIRVLLIRANTTNVALLVSIMENTKAAGIDYIIELS
jgi:hypothetical protein